VDSSPWRASGHSEARCAGRLLGQEQVWCVVVFVEKRQPLAGRDADIFRSTEMADSRLPAPSKTPELAPGFRELCGKICGTEKIAPVLIRLGYSNLDPLGLFFGDVADLGDLLIRKNGDTPVTILFRLSPSAHDCFTPCRKLFICADAASELLIGTYS
jgi:hypothetical protein